MNGTYCPSLHIFTCLDYRDRRQLAKLQQLQQQLQPTLYSARYSGCGVCVKESANTNLE